MGTPVDDSRSIIGPRLHTTPTSTHTMGSSRDDRAERVYDATGRGLGLLAETHILLELWQADMDVMALYQAALQSGRFPTVSARRLRNIVVEGFAPRYLINDGVPATLLHKLPSTLTTSALTQLLLLYTCRAHAILADFVCDVYWERSRAGHASLSNTDA